MAAKDGHSVKFVAVDIGGKATRALDQFKRASGTSRIPSWFYFHNGRWVAYEMASRTKEALFSFATAQRDLLSEPLPNDWPGFHNFTLTLDEQWQDTKTLRMAATCVLSGVSLVGGLFTGWVLL